MNIFTKIIARQLSLPQEGVENTLKLLDEGCTIPFISRYRKERTGGLDEVQIAQISEMNARLKETAKRKETILKTIGEQGKLTDELKKRIDDCWDNTELEDIYLPYKPKRRTRAQVAREQGLEPLATLLMMQREPNPVKAAERFVRGDVKDVPMALHGAQDIIAEQVSEDEGSRNVVRQQFRRDALIVSKVVKAKKDTDEAQKYSDYFEWEEPLRRCSSHRLLAMRRGESEGVLRVKIETDDEQCITRLQRHYVKGHGKCQRLVAEAVEDGYNRLLQPSIETEFAAMSKEKADQEAIQVFTQNLRQLLMDAPLGQKRVMGIDPGFRTGCKVVCLDAQGNLLHHEAIFPHPPVNRIMEAKMHVLDMISDYQIEAIAIGNGTASRETREFIEDIASHAEGAPSVFVVSEDGASVYSASKIAREEFPDEDVTVRGAVSIGRRLMDPLAELVKIDPKSLGVGQYQHDVDQGLLKEKLDNTVEMCVNSVGVNLNTASPYLLAYVAGIGPALAAKIVAYRTDTGVFKSRAELMKVPRLGAKAFEQCAGFLRIPDASNPLDNSAVHPECYHIVDRMARDLGVSTAELVGNAELCSGISASDYVEGDFGLPTVNDILKELAKPGRDPREAASEFEFSQDVHDLEDLFPGMELPGIVTNITNFGAFVDVGLHENGLIHVSQMGVRGHVEPAKILKLHQRIRVSVLDVDLERKRISLRLLNS